MILSLPFPLRTTSRPKLQRTRARGPTITQQPRGRGLHCRTLTPHLLEPSDLLDLSWRARPHLHTPSGDRVRLRYHKHDAHELVFPPNTRGFLYYHHDPATPRSSGEIRFRLAPASIPDFASAAGAGADLTTPGYIPWSLTLFQLTNPTYAPLKDLLLQEGLADEALVQSMAGKTFRGQKRPLHYLEQPFVMDLQSSNFMFKVFDGETLGTVRYEWPFRDSRATVMANPYSGHLLLRFERSPLPQHANSRIIVLRILKILEAIRVTIPGYDMHLPLPQEGQFLESMNRDRRTRSPFVINLDKRTAIWKDLNLLVKK